MNPPISRLPSEVRIGLAGLGTVGSAVARLLAEEGPRFEEIVGVPLRITTIWDRSPQKKDLSWADPEVRLVESLEQFLEEDLDIVVELIGGTEPARELIASSLKRGKAVVTANKLLMAQEGARLLDLAADHHTFLGFEASVAGGIPILRTVMRSLISDRIVALRGILNGTCNFILSEMSESGRRFQDVLSQAQVLGYAEADPFLDVSGRDTADKLAILASLSFGGWVDPQTIPTRGITDIHPIDFAYSSRLGASIRMLGIAQTQEQKLSLRVSPFLVDDRLPLSKVSGVLNAVEVSGARLGSAMFSGPGAGGKPTAVSAAADILNAALWMTQREHFDPLWVRRLRVSKGADSSHPPGSERFPFYLRFFVEDQPGILAAIAGILAQHQINIDAVYQESWPSPSDLPFVISVDPTPFSKMEEALQAIGRLECNQVPPLALPILRE